jgi:uroporphyrinogen-III synthase
LEHRKIDKQILCFCVGTATEKQARSIGFQNVIAAEGNVENLKELVLQNFDQNNGKLIYISGETISVDLDRQLVREGYNIKRIVNYRTIHNQNFDENFVKELKLTMPDMVYVYSQNSALSFLNFIKIHQSQSLWMNTNLMCISEKTSSILNEIKWKKIFLFNPGEEEFLLYKI